VTLRTGSGDERLAYDDIDRAHTVFVWAPAPKPGKGPRPTPTQSGALTTTTDEKRDEES
jgi:hypothetical protein